jgi:hypothetical protein
MFFNLSCSCTTRSAEITEEDCRSLLARECDFDVSAGGSSTRGRPWWESLEADGELASTEGVLPLAGTLDGFFLVPLRADRNRYSSALLIDSTF